MQQRHRLHVPLVRSFVISEYPGHGNFQGLRQLPDLVRVMKPQTDQVTVHRVRVFKLLRSMQKRKVVQESHVAFLHACAAFVSHGSEGHSIKSLGLSLVEAGNAWSTRTERRFPSQETAGEVEDHMSLMPVQQGPAIERRFASET